MAKVYKVVKPGCSTTSESVQTTDWKRCILCQENTEEVLKCPDASRKGGAEGAGYKTMADNLIAFDKIGCLPKTLQLSRLDEGQGVEVTLRNNQAKWHDSCRLQYNKTKLQRAEKRKKPIEEETPEIKYTRKSKDEKHEVAGTCFFCDKCLAGETLHNVSTFELDARVRQCALKLQDKPLLAKLSAGDLIAQEAKYHAQCLVSLYNKARETKDYTETNKERANHGLALAGLISYIEDVRMDSAIAPIFKMSDLVTLYIKRMEQLGTPVEGRVHSTKLKDRILSYFPDMEAHKQGRDVILVCNEHVGSALRKACEHDADNDAVYLSKAANIIRRDMFEMSQKFDGSFDMLCQQESTPVSLLCLVAMVLYGSNITTQCSAATLPQPALTISQLLMFNSLVRRKECTASASRHSSERETPLPIYMGVMVHTKTRKRELVETLYDLGLSISYDRVLAISTELGDKICQHYAAKKAVCPPELRLGIFTSAAVDNIDHNPSSTTAHDSFHGTGISLFQHLDASCSGEKQILASECDDSMTKVNTLPENYTIMTPIAVPKSDVAIPKMKGSNKANCEHITQAIEKEYRWLDETKQARDADALQGNESLSWSAYHAAHQPDDDTSQCTMALTSLLPLFYDEAKSVSMIRHSMDVVQRAVDILNPNQVPIIAADQPLYALAKQIQWHWPVSHGEDKYVVMFGGLHIEMAALKVLGALLDGSGWTGALVQARVVSPGVADSLLKASHVTRTRRAHQITVSCLYVLLQKAFTDYQVSLKDADSEMSLEEWCIRRQEACPHFQFWYMILQLELLVLIYIRSIREGNFTLYVEALSKIVPWFFALGHINYARWIPVHLRDMVTLKERHPAIYAEFQKGKFVVHKTTHKFSAIAIDQAHEQNNASVKGDGGAVGLTENPAALRRWMVSGPEMARVIGEFEASTIQEKSTDTRHHEQTKHAQVAYLKDTNALCETIEDMGNPFAEYSQDLLVLDSRDVADPSVISSLRMIEHMGQEQYDKFVDERLVNQTKPITDPIKRNNLALFSRLPLKQKSKSQEHISTLKNDCSLFSRLYIASQIRDGDLDEFFAHENQACPPSLSQLGKMRTGTKSDLVPCLEDLVPATENPVQPTVQVVILDGAAIVNMVRPGTARTFADYAEQVFLPFILSQLQKVNRVDIVWDQYLPDSLKADTRQKRGKGVRRRVEASSVIPGNWQQFLRSDDNKVELFSFLAKLVASVKIGNDKEIVTTHNTEVLCTKPRDVDGLAPCTQEEADTRMFLHLNDAVKQGYHKVSLRTVDTDVLVIAIAEVQNLDIAELWVAFGVGKNFRYLPAHEMANILGPDRSKALPMFHAFTGCDTVSSFGGKGKKTAWETWKMFDDITEAFCALGDCPNSVDEWLDPVEHFVALVYDRTSNLTSVNELRKQLFSQKGRVLEGLPPTQAALVQHTKRAVYQAGYCWSQARVSDPVLPSPSDWGWIQNAAGKWEVHWTTLPEATKICRELLRCGCKKGCRGQCKCRKAALHCTALCHCAGQCAQ